MQWRALLALVLALLGGRAAGMQLFNGRRSIRDEALEEDLTARLTPNGDGVQYGPQTSASGATNPFLIAAEVKESKLCRGDGLEMLWDSEGEYIPAYPTSSKFHSRPCTEREFEGFRRIGSGAYGQVWRATHKATGLKVAIKEIRKQTDARLVRREECIQHSLNSNLVVRHYCTIAERGGIAFVLELVEGKTLYEARHENELPAKEIAAQLVLALEYLHSRRILFRDLKPENVMYSPAEQSIKIIDFGLATELRPPYWSVRGVAGTPVFMAPEVFQQGTYYSFPADWYSLGLVIYELVGGSNSNPFDGIRPESQLYRRIQAGFRCKLLDQQACDLIKHLTTLEPTGRWGISRETLRAVKKHDWFHGISWSRYDAQVAGRKPPRRRSRPLSSTTPSANTSTHTTTNSGDGSKDDDTGVSGGGDRGRPRDLRNRHRSTGTFGRSQGYRRADHLYRVRRGSSGFLGHRAEPAADTFVGLGRTRLPPFESAAVDDWKLRMDGAAMLLRKPLLGHLDMRVGGITRLSAIDEAHCYPAVFRQHPNYILFQPDFSYSSASSSAIPVFSPQQYQAKQKAKGNQPPA